MIMTINGVVVPALLAGFEAFSAGISAVMSAIQVSSKGLITFNARVFSGSWTKRGRESNRFSVLLSTDW